MKAECRQHRRIEAKPSYESSFESALAMLQVFDPHSPLSTHITFVSTELEGKSRATGAGRAEEATLGPSLTIAALTWRIDAIFGRGEDVCYDFYLMAEYHRGRLLRSAGRNVLRRAHISPLRVWTQRDMEVWMEVLFRGPKASPCSVPSPM